MNNNGKNTVTKISVLNKELLTKTYIHDDVIIDFKYDVLERVLILTLIDGFSLETLGYELEYKIGFYNVIGFNSTSCEFWGPIDRINGMISVSKENQIIIPNLFKKSNNMNSNLTKEEDYIELEIEFISGDYLNIACEYMLYGKELQKS